MSYFRKTREWFGSAWAPTLAFLGSLLLLKCVVHFNPAPDFLEISIFFIVCLALYLVAGNTPYVSFSFDTNRWFHVFSLAVGYYKRLLLWFMWMCAVGGGLTSWGLFPMTKEPALPKNAVKLCP